MPNSEEQHTLVVEGVVIKIAVDDEMRRTLSEKSEFASDLLVLQAMTNVEVR